MRYENVTTEDQAIWASLKQAIAKSSGFSQWLQDQDFDEIKNKTTIDQQVRLYLKETLETLAY
ncbi:MAG: hypothetical protein HC796_05580 [Synechococcaceae cyanobacterium RL_1_2]|nr:hypothetical protein [Synechococcaceae cyanobacterium RL_1_2]